MSTSPVNAWDMGVFAATETTLGTTPAPASTAAFAALAIEAIDCNLGAAEQGNTRAKQDRNQGRGPTNGFVEGRVMPHAWSLDTSIKSRAAIATASELLPFFKACGIKHTITADTDVTLTPSAQPIELAEFSGMTLYRMLGTGLAVREAQVLRGCVGKSMRIEGAAGELLAKFSGVGIGKTTAAGQAGVLGKLDSITVADNTTTTITISAEESKRFGLGYYLWESEIILVTACTPGGTSATIERGALSSTAAAHTAKPICPYRPAATFTGSPIAEPTSTITVDGVALEARNWSFEYTTGLDLREPATGSRYSQGAKYGRYDVKVQAQLVLTGAQVSRLGDVTARTDVALVISQGSGVGGVVTLNVPYAEVMPFTPPSTANDISIVDVEFRVRDDGAGNNAFSIVLT